MSEMKQKQRNQKPVTMKIEEFRHRVNEVVSDSGLPPFLIEILLGEYLVGISQVARREYEQDKAEWEKECEQDG